MSYEVPVCPECDATQIKKATARGPTAQYAYYCCGCYTGFADPNYRERKIEVNHAAHSPLAQALIDADPDEVTA